METRKIKSIEKGYGHGSTLFSTAKCVPDEYLVDEINEETKVIGAGFYNDLTITVYGIYKNGERIAEIEANSAITLRFESKNDPTDEQEKQCTCDSTEQKHTLDTSK